METNRLLSQVIPGLRKIVSMSQPFLCNTQLLSIVDSDPDILGGNLVSIGTRVPMKILLDCLEAGDSPCGVSRPFSYCQPRSSDLSSGNDTIAT